jgi:hypothetical protein
MIFFYKNSFIASIISITGCMLIMAGIASGFNILMILAGIPFLIGGHEYSEYVAFKKWWKKVVEANLVPEIAKSTSTAIQIYNKNPGTRTLKKIRELNSQAAANIEAQLQAKKNTKT